MPVESKHAEFQFREMDWVAIRDCVAGETAVKNRSETYLPVPPGMSPAPTDLLSSGKRATNSRYSHYLSFAEFPELLASTLNGFQGIIHGNDPHVDLPSRMEYLLEDATPEGESLDVVWERMTGEQTQVGRIIFLADVGADDNIRIAMYAAENMINWKLRPNREGGGPELVVLRQVQQEPKDDDPFVTVNVTYYLELRILDGVYKTRLWRESDKGGQSASADIVPQPGADDDGFVTPVLFGRTFTEIPIHVQNVTESGFDYEGIPALPLARRCLSIYRLSADYKRALYIKCDPQIYISGITPDQAPTKIGGEEIWALPNPQAKANYLDIDGQGIPLLADAIKDEYERYYQEGGKLLDTADRASESGEALRRRQTAQQVSLRTIAMNGGEGMEMFLRRIAVWLGLDPETVTFQPDLDFSEPQMTGRDLLELITSKNQGAPIAHRTIHDLMRRGRLTNRTYEEEVSSISDDDLELLPDVGLGGEQNLPEGPPKTEVTGAASGG